MGFVTESVATQMGNFVGKFLDFDKQAMLMDYMGVLRVRVAINVHKPLLSKKRILLPNGMSHYVKFTYEKLTLFCFICSKLGHSEGFCPFRILQEDQDFPFGLYLRAPFKRAMVSVSGWLKETILDEGTSGENHNTGVNIINGQLYSGGYRISSYPNENKKINLTHVSPIIAGPKTNFKRGSLGGFLCTLN